MERLDYKDYWIGETIVPEFVKYEFSHKEGEFILGNGNTIDECKEQIDFIIEEKEI